MAVFEEQTSLTGSSDVAPRLRQGSVVTCGDLLFHQHKELGQ